MTYKKRSLNFPISGFPEYLPQERAVELNWIKRIAEIFESHGYINIETPSVERVQDLLGNGEDTDKEIYTIARLGFETERAKLALHYDLTVPFARYTAKHFDKLIFPFRRYQIQRVWRGERPQEGRYREFTQCDIDVVDIDRLSHSFDSEVLETVIEVLDALRIPPLTFGLSNRKLLDGFCEAMEIQSRLDVARILDKLDKLPREEILAQLTERVGLPWDTAEKAVQFASLRGDPTEIRIQLTDLKLDNRNVTEGLDELDSIFDRLSGILPQNISLIVDLSIVRGFDYYTGVVYEARLDDFPEYPSICAGGRYEDLASSFAKVKLPGVGVSIGLTRLFTKLLMEGLIEEQRFSQSEVMMAFLLEGDTRSVWQTARLLRRRGIKVECYPEPIKLEKQLRYANRCGIPYVWFSNPDGTDAVKSMVTGTQEIVDPSTWQP